jgi:Family of unknown function (DUF7033)
MILIYLKTETNRSKYAFEQIFKNDFGIPYQVTTEITVFESYQGAKINYSEKRISDEFFIKASGLLLQSSLQSIEIPFGEIDTLKVLFPDTTGSDTGFDVFGAVFYMISRYEEYLPFEPDLYGRFDVKNSIAFKQDFLEAPLVDQWINYLKNCLQKKYSFLKFKTCQFRAIITYDIDVAFKFRGRGIIRSVWAGISDILKLDYKTFRERAKTIFFEEKDPWDTYDYLKNCIHECQCQAIFFFLLGNRSGNDRNLSFRNKAMNHLVREITSFSEIGIHPSFKSALHPELIQSEKKRLEKLSQLKIIKSRQHFLKFDFPDTFRALLKTGIEEDYSMGFPYHPGFRAGTSRPFYFYDLLSEKATPLKIFPVTFMEGNFMTNNGSMDPDQAKIRMLRLLDEVKKVNGTFICIWHNHTVSNTCEYKDWRMVHDEIIKTLSAANKEQTHEDL